MKELFHFDIETAGNYPDYNTFLEKDERGAKLFEKKFNKMCWSEKYGTIESAPYFCSFYHNIFIIFVIFSLNVFYFFNVI